MRAKMTSQSGNLRQRLLAEKHLLLLRLYSPVGAADLGIGTTFAALLVVPLLAWGSADVASSLHLGVSASARCWRHARIPDLAKSEAAAATKASGLDMRPMLCMGAGRTSSSDHPDRGRPSTASRGQKKAPQRATSPEPREGGSQVSLPASRWLAAEWTKLDATQIALRHVVQHYRNCPAVQG